MLTLDPVWHDAIPLRRSRRRYSERPLPPATVEALQRHCAMARLVPEARVALVKDQQQIFTGLTRSISYGRVEGAPWTALFIARQGFEIEAGYVGEAFVLEATRLGLGTCWVAGMFDREATQRLVPISPGEAVVAVSPVGYPLADKVFVERVMGAAVRSRARRPLTEIAPGVADQPGTGRRVWPRWALSAVAAARLAPSGANRQPWRFALQGDTLIMGSAASVGHTAPLDFGIAMLHAELGALHEGVRGFWQRLVPPDVAGFTRAPATLPPAQGGA